MPASAKSAHSDEWRANDNDPEVEDEEDEEEDEDEDEAHWQDAQSGAPQIGQGC